MYLRLRKRRKPIDAHNTRPGELSPDTATPDPGHGRHDDAAQRPRPPGADGTPEAEADRHPDDALHPPAQPGPKSGHD